MFEIPQLYRFINDMHTAIPKKLGNGYAFPPLRVGCVLTHRCNLKCSMCFVWKRGLNGLEKGELTTSEWLDIFRQIPRYSIITFTGGEPLIRKDIHELLDAACKKHRVHLVSNGTLMNSDFIKKCINSAPNSLLGKGLLSIGISLEGPAEVHDAMVQVPGSFERTTGAIRELIKLKHENNSKYPLIDLKIVICKDTHGSLVQLYELADEIGVDIISYQQCSTQESSYGIDDAPPDAINRVPPPVEEIDEENLTQEIHELIARAEKGQTTLRFNPEMPISYFTRRYQNRFPLKHFTCSAAWSIMHIGPYGTVYPCFSIPMGSLKTHSIKDIWNGEKYQTFRKKLKESSIFPGCIGCCVMKMKNQENSTNSEG